MKHGKRYRELLKKLSKEEYSLEEAIKLVRELSNAKFPESVDISLNLGIDPRKQDQVVRGTVVLPHGTGKTRKILVFTKGAKVDEAKEAGADYVGLEDYAEKIQKEGWFDFDVALATPDAMSVVGKLGRILGPRGLMPSAKSKTVTMDIKDAVQEIKKGRIVLKNDKGGNIHAVIGKVNFDEKALKENLISLIAELLRIKPAGVKGQYVRSAYISPTMGPSLKLNTKELLEIARKEAF